MPEIPIDIRDPSSDEEVIKAKMTKLTHTNWVQWSCQFKNYLVSKGMDDLLDPPSEDVKKTTKFKKRNGGALTLLWSSVSTEFKGVLLNNKSSFYNCCVGLGNCCATNSVVAICRMLQKLHEPITKHGCSLFLQSLDNDEELSGLCQKLYDTKAFELSTITDRVLIEHTRRESSHDQALLFDKNKQSESAKSKGKNKSEGGHKKTGFKDRKKGKSNNQGTMKNPTQEQDTNKVNAASESREIIRPSGSDSDAFIFDKVNAMIGKNNQGLIYLDLGAGRTVVNDLRFLQNPTLVTKHINTFSNPVKVTNQGTLLFKGIKLYPVYYVPNGPVNLLLPLPENSIYALPTAGLDWHLTLEHPSDSYIKALLKDHKINGSFTHSSDCPVCHQAKLRTCPHSQPLPRADAPFSKIHMDTLQINPQTHKGHKYVLVLVDDYSCFNRIYLFTGKSQDTEYIKSYLMEIKNKLEITPAYLHTDRGGQFSSQSFVNFLTGQGISRKRGPPESPQTNGVAERFNQTLLSKMRGLLGQSNIPISYWDEVAAHASLLLNLLLHKHLMMNTPASVLNKKNSSIKPEIDLKRLVPFGMKVTAKISNPSSKIEPQGEILQALTFERYSDGLRLLNLETGKIRVSCNYTLRAHNPTPSMNQPASVLPNVSSLRIKFQIPSSKPEELSTQSSAAQPSNQSSNVDHNSRPSYTPTMYEPSKNYKYVPYYKEEPRNISSSINEDNIVTGKRNTHYRENILLADVVPYSKVVNNPIEAPKWKKGMDDEYHLLTSHNTGELVPYPAKPEKVIGGMWRLSCKRNKHDEVYRYKAQWVVLGNHQEHMLHYYDTWALVGRNEMFKVMLSLVVSFNYIPYQFDIETAFLHGEMDALVYIKQVKGCEVKGKEGWVWKLCKSLYGTKQAPLKQKTLTNFLDKLNSILKLKYKKKPTQHLGYNLNWSKNELKINQTHLIIKLLIQFGMNECKSVKTPCNGNFLNEIGTNLSEDVLEVTSFQQGIGSLNYLAHHTRPDIFFTKNQLSKYSLKPNQCHWNALKHLLHYLNGTKDKCLVYKQKLIKEALTRWADADYANDKEDRKSITGYFILAFSNPICWLSKKQLVVAQSTTEAEYVAMNICSKQLQWLTFVFNDLGHASLQPILFNNNSGAVTISKQAFLNTNTKHIEVGYQYVRDFVIKNLIKVVQVSTNDMIADVLTKPLGVVKLQEVYKKLHLKDPGGVLKVEENHLG
ncbi:hypothetical protein O181_009511 [Austropuccinia psidii MF-1]|uniref:Integrase catalytic domain-containing protein n=1 Tax=Austropuccinia psidii MF-1 TaxID=1389203 RepID=A0A9Q3GJJ7_9BASI|nr:hypothetical protein [Austropuccinia psidii MF-1]